MRASILMLAIFAGPLAGCGAVDQHRPGGPGFTARADTVDVLEAVWRSAAAGHQQLGRVAWLHLPERDSAYVTASAHVRRNLTQRGVQTSTRLPAGHDTVVYRVRRWTPEPGGTHLLELVSRWTTLVSGDRSQCRSAGNVETYRAHRGSSGWSAGLAGPVAHGDGPCETVR